MRRFFIGLISGGFVATLGLVIVSQIAPPPGSVVGAQTAATGGVVNDTAQVADSAAEPVGDLLSNDTAAVLPAAPAIAVTPEVAPDVTAPAAAKPLTEVSGVGSNAIPASAETVNATIPDAPVDTVTSPATNAPQIDGTAAVPAPVVETPPVEAAAVPPAASSPAVPLTDVPQPRPAPDVTDNAAVPAADRTASLGQTGPDAPAAPGADAPPPLADLPPPLPLTPAELAVLAPVPAPDAEAVDNAQPPPVLPAETALPDAETAAPAPPAVVVPDMNVAPLPDVIATAPAPTPEPEVIDVDAAPSVLQPDTPLVETAPELPSTPRFANAREGVIVNRPTEADPASESPVLPEVELDAQPPITRFAAAFENPDAKPLFSIVLIDMGEATLDRVAIAALPFAVSVAIDPLSPDAAAHAALYLAGGKEVLMLASGIPAGASPADLEQTFQALDAVLPEAVAVVDTETASFQDDRPLATQIVPILAAQGRGLLTWDRGLNAADQVARREGLASAVIFRRIDRDGEAIPVIRRYLDRAAFKAAQEGQVTVIGQARAETLAALLEWTVEGRASSVAIAPVSAQLTPR